MESPFQCIKQIVSRAKYTNHAKFYQYGIKIILTEYLYDLFLDDMHATSDFNAQKLKTREHLLTGF